MRDEGVTGYDFELRPPPAEAADLVPRDVLATMNAVRRVLRAIGMIGRDPARYGGLGFGNLSVREPGPSRRGAFWITASQTGGLEELGPGDVCRVDAWDIAAFRLVATGLRAPSSEALTHAMICEVDERAAVILHVHDPWIWRSAERLLLATTDAHAGYGSPAMAESVRWLLASHAARPLLFVTPGHEDGVFAVGEDAASAVGALVGAHVRAAAQV